ncbi:MAG: hypothetical protein E2P02_10620 [Acidobacteria bacterium]|nr:MAG: hypothetical protein E2P02_10620 [Acidobacteriota bacterium]
MRSSQYRSRECKRRLLRASRLNEEFSRDKERLERFEREARLLTQLNHANIATLHGLEEHNGHQCLIMELVEGETLAERSDIWAFGCVLFEAITRRAPFLGETLSPGPELTGDPNLVGASRANQTSSLSAVGPSRLRQRRGHHRGCLRPCHPRSSRLLVFMEPRWPSRVDGGSEPRWSYETGELFFRNGNV